MDRLSLMRTFVAAIEARSFSAAAGRLNSDPKLVSKHMAALEHDLGVRLFHRTTRSLSATDEGRRFYEGAVDILARNDELAASLRAEASALVGTLRVSAPVAWGEIVLRPLVSRFATLNPELKFDIRLSDRFVDLAEEGFDLALRVGGPDASALIAKRLGEIHLILVAAPILLERVGTPATAVDLASAPTVGDANLRTGQIWVLNGPDGAEVRLPISPRFTVNSTRIAADIAISGEGFAQLPEFSVAEALKHGKLLQVLPDWTGPVLPLRAVFLEPRQLPLRVRRFVDFLADEMRQEDQPQ